MTTMTTTTTTIHVESFVNNEGVKSMMKQNERKVMTSLRRKVIAALLFLLVFNMIFHQIGDTKSFYVCAYCDAMAWLKA